jgi:hypothetical protein
VIERVILLWCMSESGFVKGFGCRPQRWRRGIFGRPASESLQGCYGRAATVEEYGIIGADVNRWSTPCRS